MRGLPIVVLASAFGWASCNPAPEPTPDPDTGQETGEPNVDPVVDPFYADEPPVISNEALLAEFYQEHPRDSLPPDVVSIVETYIAVEDAIYRDAYSEARDLLDAHKVAYPWSDPVWLSARSGANGINVGSPVGYYGLRMMDEIVQWRLENGPSEAKPVVMTIALIGCSEAIQPRTLEEYQNGEGVATKKLLNPVLREDDYRTLRQSVRLFRRYMEAASQGTLRVEIQIADLTETCVDVNMFIGDNGLWFASPLIWDTFDEMPPGVVDSTDWWMFVAPSMAAYEFDDFKDGGFITGGQSRAFNGAPTITADDYSITNKPPALGYGKFTELERRLYLPQWEQHEFYHHLFSVWPEFGLEVTSHQWFDRRTWPAEFEGAIEPDYYAEALHKRLQSAVPPMSTALRYSKPATGDFSTLTLTDLVGDYRKEPVENDWHVVSVTADGANLRWTNAAGATWLVTGDPTTGALQTGDDCPYGATEVPIALIRGEDGSFGEIRGLVFQGAHYDLQ